MISSYAYALATFVLPSQSSTLRGKFHWWHGRMAPWPSSILTKLPVGRDKVATDISFRITDRFYCSSFRNFKSSFRSLPMGPLRVNISIHLSLFTHSTLRFAPGLALNPNREQFRCGSQACLFWKVCVEMAAPDMLADTLQMQHGNFLFAILCRFGQYPRYWHASCFSYESVLFRIGPENIC